VMEQKTRNGLGFFLTLEKLEEMYM